MFVGEFTPRLDDKGRLTLPAKIRAALEEDVVVLTKGQENCIAVYPRAEFHRVAEQLHSQGRGETNRIMVRQLASGADDQPVDGQGRISINAGLRRYAHLDRACTVIGAIRHFEIWDAAAWSAYSTATESRYSQAREDVFSTPGSP